MKRGNSRVRHIIFAQLKKKLRGCIIFEVKVPEKVEDVFREVAGELAPDPLNIDRLRLNRLLHQTPDLPDK